MKSLTLPRNPVDSGCVEDDDNLSNSARSSRCFLVRFCGVSTRICTYMSPLCRARSTGMPLPESRKRWPDCVPPGTLTQGLAANDGRLLDLAAHDRRHDGDRHPAMQVGAFALEERVGADRQENIKIARRAAAHAGFAFAGEAG